MGYSWKYDTNYDDQSGEWLEKIGFCPDEDHCTFCAAYNADGRPATAFDAPEDAMHCTYSSTDRISDSGSDDEGSNPGG